MKGIQGHSRDVVSVSTPRSRDGSAVFRALQHLQLRGGRRPWKGPQGSGGENFD